MNGTFIASAIEVKVKLEIKTKLEVNNTLYIVFITILVQLHEICVSNYPQTSCEYFGDRNSYIHS